MISMIENSIYVQKSSVQVRGVSLDIWVFHTLRGLYESRRMAKKIFLRGIQEVKERG